MKHIAIDWDETFTADPELWQSFIDIAHARGHRVYCVTCRRDTEENRAIVRVPGLSEYRHYFTGLSPKRWFMEQRGISIDIWIDDQPESVKEGRL